MAKLRPGRKRVTTSFTLPPDLHTQFHDKLPQFGQRSAVMEGLIRAYVSGKIKFHKSIGFYGQIQDDSAA